MTALALAIDFRAEAYRRSPRRGWILFALGVLAVVGVFILKDARSTHLRALESHNQALQHRIDAHQRDERAALADPATAQRVKEAQQALAALTIPWSGLLEMLEGAGTRDIALLSVAPEAKSGRLEIVAEARTVGEALAYVQRLSGQPTFSDVHLTTYAAAVREGVPVIDFTVDARWK